MTEFLPASRPTPERPHAHGIAPCSECARFYYERGLRDGVQDALREIQECLRMRAES